MYLSHARARLPVVGLGCILAFCRGSCSDGMSKISSVYQHDALSLNRIASIYPRLSDRLTRQVKGESNRCRLQLIVADITGITNVLAQSYFLKWSNSKQATIVSITGQPILNTNMAISTAPERGTQQGKSTSIDSSNQCSQLHDEIGAHI